MFPQSGSGIIKREPIFPRHSTEFSFSVPDSLYPYSEDNLKYELYRHLSHCDWNGCYCEVQLVQDEAEAIDIIWMDGENRRRVGIEVKTPKGLVRNDVSEQLDRYRNRTLSEFTGKTSLLKDNERRDASEFYVLDELWLATFQRPRINSKVTNHESRFDELDNLIDGYIQFNHSSGEYQYDIDKSGQRKTHWKKNLPFREHTDPEPPYVAEVYKHLRNEGHIVTAEAPFAIASEREITPDGIDRKTTRQADLVFAKQDIGEKFDCEDSKIRALEIKGRLSPNNNYVRQLQRYYNSQIFTHVSFVSPLAIDSSSVKNELPVKSEKLVHRFGIVGGETGLLNQILSELPSTGIIELSKEIGNEATKSSSSEPTHIAEAERVSLDEVPFVKFYRDGDKQWYSKC